MPSNRAAQMGDSKDFDTITSKSSGITAPLAKLDPPQGPGVEKWDVVTRNDRETPGDDSHD